MGKPPYSRRAHITVRGQKGNHVLKSSAIEDKDLELDWLLQGFVNCDLGRRCLWCPQLWTRRYLPTDTQSSWNGWDQKKVGMLQAVTV